MADEKINLSESLRELKLINEWFDSQEDADVEEWLAKIKKWVALIKASRIRLREVENEFTEIKRDLEGSWS